MAVDRIGDGLALRSKGDIVSHDGTNPISISAGTNGQILYAQSSATAGVQWQTPPTSETQYIEVIASTYLTSDATTVSFTSIPATYKDLYLRWAVQCKSNDELRVSFNSTTSGTDHEWAYLYTTNDVFASFVSTSYILLQNANLNTADSGYSFSPGNMTIYQYANTSYHKNGESHGGSFQTTYPYSRTITFTYKNTSAITRIDFDNAGSNFSAGSHFTLYGIKE